MQSFQTAPGTIVTINTPMNRGRSVAPGSSIGTQDIYPTTGRNPNMPNKPTEFGRAFNVDMPKIIQTYLLNEWDDDHHKRIRKGMIVFAHSSIDRSMLSRTTMASIAKLNEILRQHDDNIRRRYKMNEFQAQDHEYNTVMELLTTRGDSYVASVLDGSISDSNFRNLLATDAAVLSLARDAIMVNWHFAGVVEVAEIPQNRNQMERSLQFPSIAAVTDKQVDIGNYFGTRKTVTSGTSVWLILKRLPTSNPANPGPFQYTPYLTTSKQKPPRSVLMYTDLAGLPQLGIPIFLGTVYRPPERNVNSAMQRAALGLPGSTERASFEAFPALSTFEIMLRR